jgi:hypothetical protein
VFSVNEQVKAITSLLDIGGADSDALALAENILKTPLSNGQPFNFSDALKGIAYSYGMYFLFCVEISLYQFLFSKT